ncbi:hypothetical protein MKW98_014450 [Papaver atlanticum]|uniref:Rad60/SUMO-like domain-containing protein n=1 Tax=Papaver atlanticum TaxID=357466 RepID=A0AAD4RZE8_9MAGN|nr:hypothetical protein MKW98_014450 [Papaver atlanticum]
MEDKPEEELEPLFDYSRVQPTANFISLDDDGSDCEHVFKFSPKRRKKLVSDESDEKKVEVKSVIDLDDNEDDWLLPPPPVVSKSNAELENSTIKQLRLKKQELASFALSAGEVLEAVEDSAKKELSSSGTDAKTEQPPKVCDERAKIIISIQDKDGAKQFKVYVDEKFEKFFKQYADKVKREIQSLAFCFDGDKINPAETPASLGMEDDDIIEVYTADSARLCLCCDSKVHSANSLSSAHYRALLCEACGKAPASVNCLDHPLFMCANCDINLHTDEEKTTQHQKRVMTNYYGCPSAKDFAELWGYDFNQLHSNDNFDISSPQGLSLGGSNTSTVYGSSSIPPPVCGAKFNLGSTNLNRKVFSNNLLLQDTRFVLQQILNLDKLQYAERNNVRTDLYTVGNNTQGHPCDDLVHNRPYLQGLGIDLQQDSGSMNHQEVHGPFTFPFSQLEHLTSTSSVGIAFQGDPSSQLWSQNMQDLGICEEIDCREFHDDLGIPDVDLTFQNYEDLFGEDHQTRDNLAVEISPTQPR